ncbi:Redox-sensing transcriptional repressor rex [Anaerohalosphaera lusitana]|uniref:Redox-sensing transcriptional repressor Rex n=2 Tax=Anaerohalosphaera lusitana TaxID=1936003 RepID=A0A1U9NKN7_9BACT|nr:Redox-sensing transcriptional repressor rex [Anaerohalosphaera lusitana]
MYFRALVFLEKNQKDYISSSELAEFVHIKPPQIRKDFSYFGAFGTKGIGYDIKNLINEIQSILKLDSPQKAALIGAGKLGTALCLFPGFKAYGFEISAIFDKDPDKIGKKIGNTTIEDVATVDSLTQRNIKLAILAVPANTAQSTTAELVQAGITGILNLSPCYLDVPPDVKVVTIDIAMELGALPYYI